MEPEPFSRSLRWVLAVGRPVMRWSRLTVSGADVLPRSGPVLLLANHDSYWDPIAIAVAAGDRRPIRAMAKSTLWKNKVVGRLMTDMGHIPVVRATSNETAVDTARDALEAGVCIGVFPEGTRSLGRPLRARSGAGRLALAVPEAELVCVRVVGATDVVRFPHRPRITVEFFRPAGGPLRPGESPADLMQRLLEEIRSGAPGTVPGRRRKAAKYRAELSTNAG